MEEIQKGAKEDSVATRPRSSELDDPVQNQHLPVASLQNLNDVQTVPNRPFPIVSGREREFVIGEEGREGELGGGGRGEVDGFL